MRPGTAAAALTLLAAACGPTVEQAAPHIVITTPTTQHVNALPDFGSAPAAPVVRSEPLKASRGTPRTRTPVPVAQGDVWRRLANCESSSGRDSASGKYHGFFQWDLQTWHGQGETGDPHTYSYEYQLAVAKRLQAARGWSPWPTCARKLGLL